MSEVAKLMDELAKDDGINKTHLLGVNVYKASQSSPREPLCYEQGVIIVGQGAKRVYYGGDMYEYNPENYLVLPVPIPAECETFVRDEEAAMLAMMIDIDVRVLGEIIGELENLVEPELYEVKEKPKGLFVSPITAEIRETVVRLLRSLQSPVEAAVIGKEIVREFYFRLMLAKNGMTLLALTMKNTDLARIDKALKLIHSDYNKKLDVNRLASMVNMSISTFHRTFKDVTSTSPIQYIKKVRLTKAKTLLLEDHSRVNEAAAEVGYESTTQFSREFKRYFGRSPVEYSSIGRTSVIA